MPTRTYRQDRINVDPARFLGLWILASGTLVGCGHDRDAGLVTTSGHIEATEVRISAKVGGSLLSISRSEGDRVARGDVVAQIDTTDVVLLLAGARAEHAQAEADLRLRLAGARAEEIAAARAQVDRAQAELEGAERDLARMQGLLDSGSGTIKARDDARTRRDMAAAALEAAREEWRRRKTGSRPEEIEFARARVQAAEARVAQIGQQLTDATVRSPADGILTEKLAEAGEIIAPGAGLWVVTEMDRPWLTLYIGEPDLGRVRLGQEADVLTDGGERRTGRITFIAQDAEFTPKNVQTKDERVKLVYKVKVSLDNQDGLFKPGMPAQGMIRTAGGQAAATGQSGKAGVR